MDTNKLIIIRHGHSKSTQEKRLAGWWNVPITKKGLAQANKAGLILKGNQIRPDTAFTSYLDRSIRTLWTILDNLNLRWIPVIKTWRLNGRHYGALQGFTKKELEKKYGFQQLQTWRNKYSIRPPLLEKNDPRWQIHDPRYKNLRKEEIPRGESTEDAWNRVSNFWNETINKELLKHNTVLVISHRNMTRGIIKNIIGMDEYEFEKLKINQCQPFLFEYDNNLKLINTQILS